MLAKQRWQNYLRIGSASNQYRERYQGYRGYNNQALYAAAGMSTLLSVYQLKSKTSAEGNENPQKDQDNYPGNPIKRMMNSFEIPKLLKAREIQKQEEYSKRDEVDLKQVEKGITKEDYEELQELDRMFKLTEDKNQTKKQNVEGQEDFSDIDPYKQDRTMKMKHQEFRVIKVCAENLLQNGQMVQVSVCDPFNDQKFHPTDKVIIAKHNGQHYACGSFCGYDFTSLATGAFLGQKLICPTCGSTYNIQNGFVEQGPSLRNISSFLIQVREENIQLVVPEHIPAFAQKKYLEREIIDPRTFVIVGDSETALSVIDALRSGYTGRILLVATSPFGAFEN